jgi:hypothetical protein
VDHNHKHLHLKIEQVLVQIVFLMHQLDQQIHIVQIQREHVDLLPQEYDVQHPMEVQDQ